MPVQLAFLEISGTDADSYRGEVNAENNSKGTLKMQKQKKNTIKVRDLKPAKDAKGGWGHGGGGYGLHRVQ